MILYTAKSIEHLLTSYSFSAHNEELRAYI